jgi:hypothetical protein
MSNFYDRNGKSIDLTEWGQLFQNKDYKILKQESVGDYWVSTVWLGLDHGWGESRPLIFETMIFWQGTPGVVESYLDIEQERYSTEAEAFEGHKRWVARYAAHNMSIN